MSRGRMLCHYAYLLLAVEVSGARGEDDLVGVENNTFGPRELKSEFDVRACRRIVEPARLGVNHGWCRARCAD